MENVFAIIDFFLQTRCSRRETIQTAGECRGYFIFEGNVCVRKRMSLSFDWNVVIYRNLIWIVRLNFNIPMFPKICWKRVNFLHNLSPFLVSLRINDVSLWLNTAWLFSIQGNRTSGLNVKAAGWWRKGLNDLTWPLDLINLTLI